MIDIDSVNVWEIIGVIASYFIDSSDDDDGREADLVLSIGAEILEISNDEMYELILEHETNYKLECEKERS